MKPTFACNFLILLFGVNCTQQRLPQAPSQAFLEGLFGPVESIRYDVKEREFNRRNGWAWKPKKLLKIEYYDLDGFLEKEEFFIGNILCKYQHIFLYNHQGFLIRTDTIFDDPKIESSFVRHRDRYGRLVEEQSLDNDGEVRYKWLHKRAPNDRDSVIQYFDTDGMLLGQSEWIYDSEGRLIRKGHPCPNGVIWNYGFHPNGRRALFEQVDYDMDGKQLKIMREIYDTNGWKATRDYLFPDRTPKYTYYLRYTYDVDERGNWIRQYELSVDYSKEPLIPTVSKITYRTIKYRVEGILHSRALYSQDGKSILFDFTPTDSNEPIQ